MSESKTDAPPSYAIATGSSTTSSKPNTSSHSHLEVPQAQNGIPPSNRRSMEDEARPLPAGWVRQFDATEHHQFFVDTKSTPPRSIWHHPYDDDTYLATLSSEEREKIQEEEYNMKRPVTPASIDEKSHHQSSSPAAAFPGDLPPRPDHNRRTSATGSEKKSFGTKLKDKVTGTTKEERERERARRAEEERQYYEQHQRFRQALQRAQVTGQPQFFAKDRDGKDIYIEPPGYGAGYGGYGGGGYGYNPYAQGPYSNPNARFVRPTPAYGRPYGGGYGGGYGLPLAGGLLGGALLGGLIF